MASVSTLSLLLSSMLLMAATLSSQAQVKTNELNIDVQKHGKETQITLKSNETSLPLVLEFGQVLALDCNKHSLFGTLTQDTNSQELHYKLTDVYRGPSTMKACFDQALVEQFLPINSNLAVTITPERPLLLSIPENTKVRYKIDDNRSNFDIIP